VSFCHIVFGICLVQLWSVCGETSAMLFFKKKTDDRIIVGTHRIAIWVSFSSALSLVPTIE
jgi:hypothetical protein